MENKKQVGSSTYPSSSSSSFCTDLFGSKEPAAQPSASSFASIFPPPPEKLRYYQKDMHKNSSQGICGAPKQGVAENITSKKRNSIFQESVEPCSLSSSLCYGGPEDMYVNPLTTQTSGSYPNFKKDTVEDDTNGNNLSSASRGNWWQGSLYY